MKRRTYKPPIAPPALAFAEYQFTRKGIRLEPSEANCCWLYESERQRSMMGIGRDLGFSMHRPIAEISPDSPILKAAREPNAPPWLNRQDGQKLMKAQAALDLRWRDWVAESAPTVLVIGPLERLSDRELRSFFDRHSQAAEQRKSSQEKGMTPFEPHLTFSVQISTDATSRDIEHAVAEVKRKSKEFSPRTRQRQPRRDANALLYWLGIFRLYEHYFNCAPPGRGRIAWAQKQVAKVGNLKLDLVNKKLSSQMKRFKVLLRRDPFLPEIPPA